MNQLTSTEINIALLALGGLVLGLGLFSGFLKQRFYISDPIVALMLGVLLSPAVSNLIDLHHWGSPDKILEQLARVTIGIQLMGVALRLPNTYLRRHWKTVAILLGIVMPFMWLCSGLLIYFFLGLPFWVALLIGAIIAPTDPVVATSIVTGKVAHENLPSYTRHAVSAESAINDGLAYPFVLLPILMLKHSPAQALSEWITKTILWEVVGAVIFGLIWGYVAGKLLVWAERKKTLEKQSFLAYTIALSLAVLSSVKLMGGDGILAVFVAGIVFNLLIKKSDRSQEENVQEAVDRFFTIYIFVLLGLALPWQQWATLGWQVWALVIAIFLLRRLPALFLCKPLLPQEFKQQDILLLGWFGPIGVAAIFYSMLSLREVGLEIVWVISSLIICASILIHGLTAVPFTKLYGSRLLTYEKQP